MTLGEFATIQECFVATRTRTFIITKSLTWMIQCTTRPSRLDLMISDALSSGRVITTLSKLTGGQTEGDFKHKEYLFNLSMVIMVII